MTEIRAFVAHSFTEDDSGVVSKFLTYFGQLSNSRQNFSWRHAEPAEPRLLADKVISLMSETNVFIGICTRKEYVVDPDSLCNPRFFSKYYRASITQFNWKTSDWIIQEIGLAKGKGLDVILLIENGVREPGGFLGDLEYITFDRSSPEKSFGKILEMITALSPRERDTAATSAYVEAVSEVSEPEYEDWYVPIADWNRETYQERFMLATDIRDPSDAEAISRAYLATEHAAQAGNRDSWKAFCEFFRLVSGKGGTLAALKELAAAHPDNSQVIGFLARGLAFYKNYDQAASTYEIAATKSEKPIERLRLLRFAAETHARGGASASVSAVIAQMKTEVQAFGDGKAVLLDTFRSLSEIVGDNDTLVGIMEEKIDVDPSDTRTRFSLAYKHSEIGNHDLALFHYLAIPPQERDPTTWNNIGVAFDHFDLACKATTAYRKAVEMGETLAMSNLANKFLEAGFLSEAEHECSEALKQEGYHKNVTTTLAKVKSVSEEEQEQESQILKKTKERRNFYRAWGEAMLHTEPQEVAKRWRGPDCILEVTMQGSEFLALGSYEQQSVNLLARAFAGLGSGTAPDHYRIEYHGTLVWGGAIRGSVARVREGDSPAIISLGSKPNVSSVLMFLTKDQTEISVMEVTTAANARFYALTKADRT
jgi:tetratricopeptide (TPR) repeat protein